MRIALILVAAAGLSGCMLWGGGKTREVAPNPQLERTRSLINQAARDSTINASFKAELERARATLDQAVMLWNAEGGRLDEDDEEWLEIRHLNHLARQRAAIVVMRGRGVDAQRTLGEVQMERERMLAQNLKPVQTSPAPERGPVDLPQLPPLLQQAMNPRAEARGLVLTLDEQHLEAGSAALVNSDLLLDALLQYLVANPSKVVACEGHADRQDGESAGQKLSQQRARAVQEALLERGLEFSRITAIGYGSVQTFLDTDASLRGNRRVEIVISEAATADYGAGAP